ncbi:MAG TPA: ABC transporter substrate-binding protein [Caldilineaceae bacterium]|nr:ABC transporter substrate-binding protein [Caldilineaceae bacterium]
MKPHLPQARDHSHLHRSYLLSRRAFLRTTLLFGGAAAVGSLAGACAPASSGSQPGAAPAAQQSASGPTPGGVYRLVGQGDFRTLDPPGAESSEDWWSAGMVLYNQLYFYDKDGNFYADLAADVPTISDDGLVYTIPIRQGVKFHNGRELTADDVKFSLERQLWPEVYSWGKSYMENIVGYDEVIAGTVKELSGIALVDDYTVEITLKKPQAVFPALLTMSMNGIIPRQETLDAGDEWGYSVVIGTGPFKFVEWTPGERAVYERNEEYFKGAPYIERIELYLNVDPAVQMLRWENGEAEWVQNIPAAELPRVLSEEPLTQQLRQAPSVGTNRLAFHFKVPPFDDIRVRQAVAMAIDKQAIVQKRAGTVLPLEGHFAIPMLQYDADFKSQYSYDPERARELLAEAGYADGIQGVMMYIGQDTEVGQLIQADLQAIGIETELAVGQWKEWRDRIRNGDVALFMYGWAASFPDAFDFTAAWTTCASIETGYNDGAYCNERIDALVEEIEALPLQDPERIAGYREIEDIVINQDVAWVALNNPQRVALGKSYVHDDFISPIYGWPYLETAWMEPSA